MRRRGLFFGGLALVVAALVVVAVVIINQPKRPKAAQNVTISCVGGSEKSAFMADPDVVKTLKDTYGLTVQWQSMGSYDQVQLPTDQIKSRKLSCLWPSSASAQHVFEAQHKGAFPGYRAETVLQSPEVIYAGPQGTDALIRAGVVQQRGGVNYVVNMNQLLNDFVLQHKTWQELQAGNLQGPINISSTDPVKSNSGFTLSQLELTMIAVPGGSGSPSLEQARKALPTMRQIYDSQGLQATSSDNGFKQWLTQGAEYSAPLYAGYENQIIQQVIASPGSKDLLKDVRILYPDPTIYSDHPVLALDENGAKLIDALKDPALQKLAWSKYGFRSALDASYNNIADFGQIPLASQFRTIPATNSDVTTALLNCLKDAGSCS